MKSSPALCSFLILLFLSTEIHSQPVSSNPGTVARYYKNGNAGYKNKLSGEIVVEPHYSAGSEMINHTALVIENEKRGFINDEGKVIIPLIYEDASMFSEGLARVKLNGKNGFINIKGETIIPFEYDETGDFINGHARAMKNGRWGYLDTSGKERIAFQFIRANDFSEGCASVMNQQNKWGFINSKGEFIFKPNLDFAASYLNGEALVKKGNEFMFVDSKGKKIRELEEEDEEAEAGKK